MTATDRDILRHQVVAWTLLAGITVVCWLFLASPALSRSQRESDARAKLEPARKLASDGSRALAAAQADLSRTRAEFESFNQPAWAETDLSRRLEWFYGISRSAGLKVESVEPADVEILGGRRGLPLRLAARGTCAAVENALREFRSAMPDVVLRSADLTALPNPSMLSETEARQLVANFEFVWISSAAGDTQAPPAGTAATPGATTPTADLPAR